MQGQKDRPQPPSARRVGAGRAHPFVAPRSGLRRAPNKRNRIYESEYLVLGVVPANTPFERHWVASHLAWL